MGLYFIFSNWPFLGLAILLGVGIYVTIVICYYALWYDDMVVLRHEDSWSHLTWRLVNQLRQALGRMPVWDVPQGVEERQMVRVAVSCLGYIQRALRYGSVHGRAAANAANLNQTARMLVANMVEALWRVQWSREITEELGRVGGQDFTARIHRIEEIERRELRRVQKSSDALVSLATRLAELGSQVRDSDVELLLDEFGEIAMEMEEDTQAWQEVRNSRFR